MGKAGQMEHDIALMFIVLKGQSGTADRVIGSPGKSGYDIQMNAEMADRV